MRLRFAKKDEEKADLQPPTPPPELRREEEEKRLFKYIQAYDADEMNVDQRMKLIKHEVVGLSEDSRKLIDQLNKKMDLLEPELAKISKAKRIVELMAQVLEREYMKLDFIEQKWKTIHGYDHRNRVREANLDQEIDKILKQEELPPMPPAPPPPPK